MRTSISTLVAIALACGCGGERQADTPGGKHGLPVLAIEYMGEQCQAGDFEACEVLDTLEATIAMCESGDQRACEGLADIMVALDGLEETLRQEKCLDPCSEECLDTCAKVKDVKGDCLEKCLAACMMEGC